MIRTFELIHTMKELSIEEMTALRGGGLGGFHGSYAFLQPPEADKKVRVSGDAFLTSGEDRPVETVTI
jgi:hypothetical protein